MKVDICTLCMISCYFLFFENPIQVIEMIRDQLVKATATSGINVYLFE